MTKPIPALNESGLREPSSPQASSSTENVLPDLTPNTVSLESDSILGYKALILTLPIAASYILVAWLISQPSTLISPTWPSAGIAIAVTMLYGKSAVPGVLIGSFVVNTMIYGWGTFGATLISLGNALSPLLGVVLYRRTTTEDYFESPKSIGLFVLYVAVIGNLVSALVGLLTLFLFHFEGIIPLLASFMRWWLGDMTSALKLVPALYLWGRWLLSREQYPSNHHKKSELFFIWILVTGGVLLLFGYDGDGSVLHIGLMGIFIPPMIWVAQRFNPRIALTLSATVYVIVFCCTLLDRGPLAHYPNGEALIALQMMGASLSIAILIASVLNLQRWRITESLRNLNESLAERVAERTLELARSESRTRHILEMSPIPMLVTELETGRMLFVNDECIHLIGIHQEDAMHLYLRDLWVDPEERDRIISRLQNGDTIRNQEVTFHNPNGGLLWLSVAVVLTQIDHQDALMFAFKDISHHKKREDELLSQANTDTLTGLFNRRHARVLFQRLLADPKERDTAISICIFDLDYFKKINDESGHACGDKVLRSIAEIAQNELRDQDILARWGGEEFILIMPSTTQKQAHTLLERFRRRLQESTILCANGDLISCTASFGVFSDTLDPDNLNPDLFDQWVNEADLALYRAKENGRNRIETN